ncbi:hypothetical protein HOD24_03880, partial [Candidatus Peregrinibacteria bacterium]|nr:hypothetical protein [Candidatus Peregrinibacteria bacterium]
PESMQAGSINAASVVQYIGAQDGLLTEIEMNEQMKNTQLDVKARPL